MCRLLVTNNHIDRLMFLASYPKEGSASARTEAPSSKLLPKVVRYARAVLAMLWEHADLRAEFAAAHWREQHFLGDSALSSIASKSKATPRPQQLERAPAATAEFNRKTPNTFQAYAARYPVLLMPVFLHFLHLFIHSTFHEYRATPNGATNGFAMKRSQSIPALSLNARPAAAATSARTPIAATPSASALQLSIRPPRVSGGRVIAAPQGTAAVPANGQIRPQLIPLGPSRLSPQGATGRAAPISIRPPRVATTSFSGVQAGASAGGGFANPGFSGSVPQLNLASLSSFNDAPLNAGFAAGARVGGSPARAMNFVRPPTVRPQQQQGFGGVGAGVPTDRTVLWTRRASAGPSLVVTSGAHGGAPIAPPRIPAGGFHA